MQGVSTRRGDDLVQALGLQGISKSQVSRLCQELDATFVKVREAGRVVSQAVVLASGKSWAWMWARVRTEHSGCSFCAAWWPGA